MSLICLQYGQCGNQLGNTLFEVIHKDLVEWRASSLDTNSLSRWFEIDSSNHLFARAIAVDCEDKVVGSLKCNLTSGWSFRRRNIITSAAGGSGNNWALGYYENGQEFLDPVLERVRIQLENCDERADGILSLHSTAGGTGSGVNCFIAEGLRDEYPKAAMVSASILPFLSSDVCTQAYNTLLSLAKLQDSQDAVFLFSNECLYKLCSQVLKIKSVQMDDLNRLISEQVTCSLSLLTLTDLISNLVPNEEYKMICLKSTPLISDATLSFETPLSWNSVIQQLKMSLVKSELSYDLKPFSRARSAIKQREYTYHRSISNGLICRGTGYSEVSRPPLSSIFSVPTLYSGHQERPYFFSGSNTKFLKRNKYATLLSNGALPSSILDSIADSSWKFFTHKAYLHHYSKFGLTNKDYLTCTAIFETVVKNYKNL